MRREEVGGLLLLAPSWARRGVHQQINVKISHMRWLLVMTMQCVAKQRVQPLMSSMGWTQGFVNGTSLLERL